MNLYNYECDGNLILHCTYEYEPPTPPEYIDGLMVNPGYDATVNLISITTDHQNDIFDIVMDCIVEDIECKILKEYRD